MKTKTRKSYSRRRKYIQALVRKATVKKLNGRLPKLSLITRLFTGHDPTRGSGQGVFHISRVWSGRLHKSSNIAGRVGSGQEVFKHHRSGRIWSGREIFQSTGLGRVGS